MHNVVWQLFARKLSSVFPRAALTVMIPLTHVIGKSEGQRKVHKHERTAFKGWVERGMKCIGL